MILKYSVGLDISSKKVNGCISVIDENQKVTVKSSIVFSNNPKGFKELEQWMLKHQKEQTIPLVICMEATGIYHEACALYLFERQFNISIILPNKAKKYLQAIGLKSKNDIIDAKGLAQMGAEQSLKTWQPLGKFFYELRLLTRQYQNLQEQKTVIKNQLHALEHAMYSNIIVTKQLKKIINLFDKQIVELDKKIAEKLNSDIKIKTKVANICKIKGIGTLTIATILAETNGFELFENYKQVVSFAGFDVIENESGKRTGKTKISKKGNSRIRRALFMPAFSAISCKQKPFLDLYNRTFEKHGIKMKSYVAVQKKLLTTIYHLWKSGLEFDEKYQENSPNKTAETIQDNSLENNFSDLQNYKKKIKNETKQEIFSDSENKEQPKRDSLLCEIQV
jgi:transposase